VKKKSLCKGLRDSRDSIEKEKISCQGLPNSQNSILKRARACEKGLHESLNPIVKGIPTEKA
jgi:hypothetical protein